LAAVLTSSENIERRKAMEEKRGKKIERVKEIKQIQIGKRGKNRNKAKKYTISSSEEEEDSSFEMDTKDSSSELEEHDETECAGCMEKYQCTSKQEDWIKCMHCSSWFHEHCSKYLNLCDRCEKFLAKKR
jgi:hypothetical protein